MAIGRTEPKDTQMAKTIAEQLHRRMRALVANLAVECNTEMITIRGQAESYFIWQLGFFAAQEAASEAGRPCDYKIAVNSRDGAAS